MVNKSTPRDPYELIDKLVEQNTGAVQDMRLGLQEVKSALLQLVESAKETRMELRQLRDDMEILKDKNAKLWDHYFGPDGNGGTSLEHKNIKAILDDWISQSKVWRWLLGSIGGSGFLISLFNYFYKFPQPPVSH